MAIDRDDALRKAEKLLRQGRLDGAIAEYEHVVDAYPDDIATASALGDLYGRAGKGPQAVAQFMRLGDHFLKEGVQAKAAASYRKVIKLDPNHEGALLQLVEASAQQGQLGDAKTHLQAAIDKRKARGDQDGADTLAIRLAELDPTDFEARFQAAKIRVRTGKAVVADLMALAQELDARKRTSEAEELLEEVVKADPGATEVALRLAKAALARDEVARAKRFLPDTRGSKEPELLLTSSKILLKLDNLEAARDHLVRFLAVAPKAVEEVATLGEHLASPGARYAIVDLLVDHAAASGDFGKAARRLQGFLEKAPRHLAALLRLVEVCVDGDLEAALTAAQQELAEAYLEAGEPEKARVIAEDLLLRNPRSSTHKDRLRRVLVTLGEKDPDAVIAERLSMLDEDTFAEEEPAPPARPAAIPAPPVAAAPVAPAVVNHADAGFQQPISGITADTLAGLPEMDAGEEVVEFEASDAGDWSDAPAGMPAPVPVSVREPEPEPEIEPDAPSSDGGGQLETVFSGMRGKALQDTSALPPGDHAARNFRVGQTYAAAAMLKEAADAFEKAARDPRYRFRSAQSLGRLYRKHGMLTEAVEWLDIASEAPAPKIDEHRAALYELADALETTGEHTRALAVLLDLVAEQSDYRDARARIERLSRVKA
ncbi:MAG TPA: tetratricopeptide repeat protein [Vicinamibacterales bacterium]|nr:tetratricopeptide repeat protein [Vicinamibacterales bacterium]